MPHNILSGRQHIAKCADPGANAKPSIPVDGLVPRIPATRQARPRRTKSGRHCCETCCGTMKYETRRVSLRWLQQNLHIRICVIGFASCQTESQRLDGRCSGRTPDHKYRISRGVPRSVRPPCSLFAHPGEFSPGLPSFATVYPIRRLARGTLSHSGRRIRGTTESRLVPILRGSPGEQ